MKLLIKGIALSIGILSSSFAIADNPDEIFKVSYACENDQGMEVVYINTEKDNYAIINQKDEMILMQNIRMASGANYAAMDKNYTYKLYTKGDKAELVEGDDKPVLSGCKER